MTCGHTVCVYALFYICMSEAEYVVAYVWPWEGHEQLGEMMYYVEWHKWDAFGFVNRSGKGHIMFLWPR